MSLAAQQNALLARLFEPSSTAGSGQTAADSIPNRRGFQAYRTNGLELARRALSAAYPVVRQLVGDDSFAALAAALWQAHPPRRGDLAQWGAELADFVRNSPQLADEPFLPDVASAEWALHQLATVSDELADLASLQLLITCDPSAVQLRITNNAQCFHSPWPLVSIWLAHTDPASFDGTRLEQVGAQIRQRLAQPALIWRDGHQPRLREALAGEAAFIAGLRQGLPLAQALECAPALDFSAWLPLAAQSGLLLGAVAREA